MGSREIFLSGRIRAPEVLKRACRLGVLAALVLGFAPSRAAAQTLTGCGTITLSGTYTLPTGGITADTSPCLIVASDNVTINLSGQALDMTSLGDMAVAISVGEGTTAYNNTTIESGTISTAYTSTLATGAAIEINGGSGLNISGVIVKNLPNSGSACLSTNLSHDMNYGTGISITGVTGGTIGPNTVTCYQTGLSVADSSVPKGGSGTISGNTLEWNTYYMGGGNQVASGGLVLSNSSGWTVSNNTIEFNGSADPNGACLTSGTVLTCMAGLQVINGSSGNTISPNNSASSNFVVGIMTGSDTSKNSITSNTALNNGLYDLYEVGHGHGNSFRTNTCATVGGNLSLRVCQ